jgi:hypothetical protein
MAGVVSRLEGETMKILLWVCAVALLVISTSEAKVKPKNFASTTVGRSAIALDAAGLPHVAYQGTDHHLYHARFDGKKWWRELVDGTSDCGGDNAIIIDSQGHIHIIYGANRTIYTHTLVHAYFNGSAWQIVDLPVDGSAPQLALDAAGHPRILYLSGTSAPWTYRYGQYDGSEWEFEDTGLPWSWYSSGFALDADGDAHISYSVNGTGCFYATNKSGSWEPTQLAPNGGSATAIALDSTGKPHVVLGVGGALVYYNYDGTNWNHETMVDFNDADPRIQANIETVIAMAMDANDRAQIIAPVYLTSGNRYVDVSVFVYDDGAGWNGLLVDQKNTGFYPSIALDTNGVPYITYCGQSESGRAKTKWARIALSDLTGVWTNVSVSGTTVTGTLMVTNHGLDQSAKTIASLWLSDDSVLTTNDTPLVTYVKIKSLKPGASVAIPVKATYSGTLTGKYLIAVIDPNSETADRNFLDNLVPVLLGP